MMNYYNPEVEQMAIPALRKLQSERLVSLVNRLYKAVPFYKKKLDEAGISISNFSGLQDLHRLPFTKKNDLRDNYPFGLFATPMHDVIRIHASSGTTGKPTVVGYTRNDIALFSEVVARSLVAAGARPGMMLQNAYGYGLFTGGLGIHYGGEALGMAVVPVSGGMTDRQIRLLVDFRPDVISCTPSYAQTLAVALAAQGIDPESLNLKYAVLGAEPWTEAIRAEVEKGLGVQATNIYGLSEIIGPGVSQEDVEERGTGSYIWEDHFFPEIVDRNTGEPLPEGKEGVLVFTTLTKEAMPLLRYWTGDITTLYYDHSKKRTHIKMGPVLGRADDMLIIRGVNFFPSQVEDLLTSSTDLSAHYQIIVSRSAQMDEVELKVEVNEGVIEKMSIEERQVNFNVGDGILGRQFAKKIKDNIGISFRVTVVQPGQIPKSEGGKLKRVIDLRK